jgi:hypothetical protein
MHGRCWVLICPTSLNVRQFFEKSVLICPTSLNVRQIFEKSVLICPTSLNVRHIFEESVLICPTSLNVRQFFFKKVPLYARLHEMSSYFFPHSSYMSACNSYQPHLYPQTILKCPLTYLFTTRLSLHLRQILYKTINPYMAACTNCPPNILHIVLEVRLHDISEPPPPSPFL